MSKPFKYLFEYKRLGTWTTEEGRKYYEKHSFMIKTENFWWTTTNVYRNRIGGTNVIHKPTSDGISLRSTEIPAPFAE